MIDTVGKKFIRDLSDIYDAEHRFLEAQELMQTRATSSLLREMLVEHGAQTREQIQNLDAIYNLMGTTPLRGNCAAAIGLVDEGDAMMSEAAGVVELLDTAIATAVGKVEHYEIACYRNLLATASHFDQRAVTDLLRRNLEQEERTAKRVEDGYERLLDFAINTQKLQASLGGPTFS